MILYILLCLIINNFFEILLNATFSNLEVNFLLLLALFVVKNMWNNQFWLIIAVSPSHYKGNGDWSFVYFPKNGGASIFPHKRGLGKIVEEG